MTFYPLSYVTCRHIQYADLHGCNVLCCRYVLRRVRVRFRVTVYTQLAVGVYWDSTPLTASAEIFKVYISFTLFTCDCTLIYTLMYCVCQHTDPGMAQKHRGLTRFESGRCKKWYSEHMLTVGHDPRNWKLLRIGSLKNLIFKKTPFTSHLF